MHGDPQPWKLNVGTIDRPATEDRAFKTLTLLRNAAIKVLREFEPRIRRWNPHGINALHDQILLIQSLTDLPEARRIDVVLDADTGVSIRLILFNIQNQKGA
jgi:hypothetical protein